MGADLIIDKDSEEIAYFRDSYNCYNVLWQFDGNYGAMVRLDNDYERIMYMKEKLHNSEYTVKEWKILFKPEIYDIFVDKLERLKKWIKIAESCVNTDGEIKKGYEIIWSC